MPDPASGFLSALTALSEANVDFVIVGVGGINFYARTPAQAYATLDLDALIDPSVENLRAALRVLKELGYAFEAGGQPFLDLDDPSALRAAIRNGATLSAFHPDAGQIDVLLSISGFSYAELTSDATKFQIGAVEVRVGALEKLLRSKHASGRPKDLEFLRTFEAGGSDEEWDS